MHIYEIWCQARLSELDLFGESGLREACVLRYKEKRRNRLFSTKIRYQVRKLNADQRPRMKVYTYLYYCREMLKLKLICFIYFLEKCYIYCQLR